MATLRLITKNLALNNFAEIAGLQKWYSQFPKSFEKPIINKQEIANLAEEGKLEQMKFVPMLPADDSTSSSEFYDELTHKFTKYIMREGKKVLARKIVSRTFENIKRIQVTKYNKAPPEERSEIELDPKVILAKAVENVCPVMILKPIKRGGITYQVPVPITLSKSKFTGMNWLVKAGQDKDKKVHMHTKLAYELIDASMNTGRVINQKKELYRKCEANRAYAHYRWM